MNENFSISDLIKIGLTKSEAVIYLNLLKKKSFTASEISRLSGISRSKTYEILNQLVKKGLCVEILGGVKKYSPANPETAFNGILQKLQHDYQQEFENKKTLISKLSETLFPFYHSEKENTDPLDYIQVIRERSRLVEKVESLERMVKYEELAFNKAPYAMNINQDSISKREEFNKLKIGITFKSIYEVDDARKLEFLKNIETFISAGEEVKIANELPMKMMIFDEKIVIIAFQDKITSKPSLTTMIVEHPDLSKALKETFNMYWQKAITLEEFKNMEKIL